MQGQAYPGISNIGTEKKLQELQVLYLKDRNQTYFKEMFNLILPYARSQVLKKTKGKVFLPPELVYDYSLDASIKFLSQYDNPKFQVDSSFGGLLGLKVLESMHGPKIIRADQVGSLNQHLERNDSGTELGELAESFGFKYMFHPTSHDVYDDPALYLFDKEEDAIESVMTVLNDLYLSTTLLEYLNITRALVQFIKHSKSYDRLKKTFLNEKEIETLDLTILEISKRLKNEA
jgi:hypothetical protein